MDAYAFQPESGHEAVRWLSETSACYDRAGLATRAAETTETLSQFQTRLQRDLRLHHLRLQLALAQNRHETAHAEVQVVRALLPADPESRYRRWLDATERRLP